MTPTTKEDPEVSAVASIVAVLADIDEAAQRRVLEWAIDRYVRQPRVVAEAAKR